MQTPSSLSSVGSSDSRGRSRPNLITVFGLSPPSSVITRAASGSQAPGSPGGGSKFHVAHPAPTPRSTSALPKQTLAGNQDRGAGTKDRTLLARPLRGSQSSHGRLGVRSPSLRLHASRTPSVNSINALQLTPIDSGMRLTAYDQPTPIQQPFTLQPVQNRGSSVTSAGSASSRHGLSSLPLRPLRSDTHTATVPVDSLSSSRSWISLSPVGSKVLSFHDQFNKKPLERNESGARVQHCSFSAGGQKAGTVQGTDVWPALGIKRNKIQFEEQVTEARYGEGAITVGSPSLGRLAWSGPKRESRTGILKKTPSFGLQATSSNATPLTRVRVSDYSGQKRVSQTGIGQGRSTDLMPDDQALKNAFFQASTAPQWRSQDVLSCPQQDQTEERYTVGFVKTFSNPLFAHRLIPTLPQLQVPLPTGQKLWGNFPSAASARADTGKDTVSSVDHSSTHPPSSEQRSISGSPPRPTLEPTPDIQNQTDVLTAVSSPQIVEVSRVGSAVLAAPLPPRQRHILSDEDLLSITTSRTPEEDRPAMQNDNVTRRKIPRNFYSNYEEMTVPEVSAAVRESAKSIAKSGKDDETRKRPPLSAVQNMGVVPVTDTSTESAGAACPQIPNLPPVTTPATESRSPPPVESALIRSEDEVRTEPGTKNEAGISHSNNEDISPDVTDGTPEQELQRDEPRYSIDVLEAYVTVILQPAAAESLQKERRNEECHTTPGQHYTASETVKSQPRKPVHITRVVQGGFHDDTPIKRPETLEGLKAAAIEDYCEAQGTSALDKPKLEPLALGHVETDPSCSGINDAETDVAAADKEKWSDESKLEEFEPVGLTGMTGAEAALDDARQRRIRLLETMGIKSRNRSDLALDEVEEKRRIDQMALLSSLDVIQAEDAMLDTQTGNKDHTTRERVTDVTGRPRRIQPEDITTQSTMHTTVSVNPPRETTDIEMLAIDQTSMTDSERKRNSDSSVAMQQDLNTNIAMRAHAPKVPPAVTRDAAQDETGSSDRRVVEYLPRPLKPRWRVIGDDEVERLQVELRMQPGETDDLKIVASAVDAEKQTVAASSEVTEAEIKLTREGLTADEEGPEISQSNRGRSDLVGEAAGPDINLSTGPSSDELTAMEALIITPDTVTDAEQSTKGGLEPVRLVEYNVDSLEKTRFPDLRRPFKVYPVYRGNSSERSAVGPAVTPEQEQVIQKEHEEYCLKEALERFVRRVAVPGVCDTSIMDGHSDPHGVTSPRDNAEPTTSQKELQVTYLEKPRQDRYIKNYRHPLLELPRSSRSNQRQDVQADRAAYVPARARVVHHRASNCTIRKIDPGVLTYLVEVYPVVTDTQENQSDLVMAEEELLMSEILEQITASTLMPSEARTDGGHRLSRGVPNVLSSESLTQLRHSYAAKVADKIISKDVIGEFTSAFPTDQKTQPSDLQEQSSSYSKERPSAGQPDTGTAAEDARDTAVSPATADAEPRHLMSMYFEALHQSLSGGRSISDKDDALCSSRKEDTVKRDPSFERHDDTPIIAAQSDYSDQDKFRLAMATTDDICTLLLLPWGEATASITLPAVWTRHQHTPCGFFVATNINQGRICGAASVLLFGNDVATCTFFLVMPEYGFKDLGHLLWNQVLHFCKGKNLMTVLPQADSTELLSRYPFHVCHVGTILRGPIIASVEDFRDVVPVIEYNETFFNALAEYDRDIFGFDRERFLGYTLKEDGLLVRIALGKDEDIRGYAAVQTDRWCCPVLRWLIADDYAVAESLLHNLIRACCDEGSMGIHVALYTRSPITKAICGKTNTTLLTPWQVLYNRREPVFSWHRVISLADF